MPTKQIKEDDYEKWDENPIRQLRYFDADANDVAQLSPDDVTGTTTHLTSGPVTYLERLTAEGTIIERLAQLRQIWEPTPIELHQEEIDRTNYKTDEFIAGC